MEGPRPRPPAPCPFLPSDCTLFSPPHLLVLGAPSGPRHAPSAAQQPEKQQTPSQRPWESLRKAHGTPAWVRKELEPLPPAPLELRSVEWEKAGATIPLVAQDIIDLQTEV